MLVESVRSEELAEVAVEVLIWLSDHPDILARFLDVSGVQPQEIRASMARPAFQRGLIEFVMNHEPDLIAFSAERAIPLGRVAALNAGGPAAP